MTEQELEALRQRFHLVTERDIEAIKNKLRLTIHILQAFLDKPDDLSVGLSIYEDDHNAHFETCNLVPSADGIGYQVRNARFIDIPFELAEALKTFLEDAKICEYGDELEYPELGTLETIKQKLQKQIEDNKGYIVSNEKRIAEFEVLLQKVGEHEKETS